MPRRTAGKHHIVGKARLADDMVWDRGKQRPRARRFGCAVEADDEHFGGHVDAVTFCFLTHRDDLGFYMTALTIMTTLFVLGLLAIKGEG